MIAGSLAVALALGGCGSDEATPSTTCAPTTPPPAGDGRDIQFSPVFGDCSGSGTGSDSDESDGDLSESGDSVTTDSNSDGGSGGGSGVPCPFLSVEEVEGEQARPAAIQTVVVDKPSLLDVVRSSNADYGTVTSASTCNFYTDSSDNHVDLVLVRFAESVEELDLVDRVAGVSDSDNFGVLSEQVLQDEGFAAVMIEAPMGPTVVGNVGGSAAMLTVSDMCGTSACNRGLGSHPGDLALAESAARRLTFDPAA